MGQEYSGQNAHFEKFLKYDVGQVTWLTLSL